MATEFILTDLWGDMQGHSAPQAIKNLLATLDSADAEHGDVAISLPNAWTLSVYANGNVVFENVEDRAAKPRHMRHVARSDALRLMTLLANENMQALEAEPWSSGYPGRE